MDDNRMWTVPWRIPAEDGQDEVRGEEVVMCSDEADSYRQVAYLVRRLYGDVSVVCGQARG